MKTLQPKEQNDMVANNNNCKVSKNKHTTDEDKKWKQIHLEIKIHNENLKNINKIERYKELNMIERKKDINITKIDKYKKKLNSCTMMKHKTDMKLRNT